MSGLIDLTGEKFGRLIVIRLSQQRGNGQAMWVCQCSCGVKVRVRGNSLRNNVTRSCGCFRKETSSNLNRKHSKCGTPIYKVWQGMKERCYNKNRVWDYPRYGSRGIRVCKRWHSFINFYEDMGEVPKGKTLDRRNNSEDYSLSNCRWATRKQQANNTRRNRVITAKGVTLTIAQWSEKTGLAYACLYKRLINGWQPETIVSQPSRRVKL